ncbi:TPA: hypothetical protein ACH3X1_014883 [Trebouxia sp. C0004]
MEPAKLRQQILSSNKTASEKAEDLLLKREVNEMSKVEWRELIAGIPEDVEREIGRLKSADISGAVKSVDDSIGVMQSLFAPFPEIMFPRTLDTTSLAGLLGAPLACRVPLPQSQYQHANRLFPGLFCPETTISAHDLHPYLITALQASWPTGSPTELLLTTFWDVVGYKLPEFAAGHLGIAVSENSFWTMYLLLVVRTNLHVVKCVWRSQSFC